MQKVELQNVPIIYPLPAVMVSCGNTPPMYNIITISWTGTICSEPPMCYISVRKSRHSHAIILQTMEFVINLTDTNLAFATDYCGNVSGKKVNKFEKLSLTPQKSLQIETPSILEAPISIECKVVQVMPLGSHDMFVAKVVAVTGAETLLSQTGRKAELGAANLIHYTQGTYYQQGTEIGKSGFSVKNKNS